MLKKIITNLSVVYLVSLSPYRYLVSLLLYHPLRKINKCEYLLQYDLEWHVRIRICQNPSSSLKDKGVVKNITWCIFLLYIVERACNRPPNNVAFQSLWTWWLEQQATVLRHDGDKSIHFCLCNGPISSAAVAITPDVSIKKQGLCWGL